MICMINGTLSGFKNWTLIVDVTVDRIGDEVESFKGRKKQGEKGSLKALEL